MGSNLFHSFSEFNLRTPDGGSPETATFTGPATVTNVITRVTGTSASEINGTLQTSGMPNAHFFLINNHGVIFGPNAELDLDGSFVVASADVVKLAKGQFHVSDPGSSVLSSAAPVAFGFLGSPTGRIEINGDPDPDAPLTTLRVEQGEVITAIGGEVTMNHASLFARSGRINVVSVSSAGDVEVDPTDSSSTVKIDPSQLRGNIELRNDSRLIADPLGSSRIVIRGGTFQMDDARITATVNGIFGGGSDGEGIDIELTGDLTARNTIIDTSASGSVSAPVAAGPIHIVADNVTLDGQGEAGATVIRAEKGGPDSGVGGSITINATSLTVKEGANITTTTFGPADGGDITVIATESVRLDGRSAEGDEIASSIISLSTAPINGGRSGNISVTAPVVEIVSGAEMATSSTGSGTSGNIDVISSKRFLIDGAGSSFFTGISASSLGVDPMNPGLNFGRAGQVTINSDGPITVRNRGSIATAAFQADGQPLTVVAGSGIEVLFGSRITAQAAGDGGDIQITAPQRIYANHGVITAEAGRDGGNIRLGGPITVNGMTVNTSPQFVVLNHSEIVADAVGFGGDIFVRTPVFLQSSTSITADSQSGNPGQIQINSPETDLSGGLVQLPESPIRAEDLLSEQCAVKLEGDFSSFVIVGRGGLPVTPGNLYPSFDDQTARPRQPKESNEGQ